MFKIAEWTPYQTEKLIDFIKSNNIKFKVLNTFGEGGMAFIPGSKNKRIAKILIANPKTHPEAYDFISHQTGLDLDEIANHITGHELGHILSIRRQRPIEMVPEEAIHELKDSGRFNPKNLDNLRKALARLRSEQMANAYKTATEDITPLEKSTLGVHGLRPPYETYLQGFHADYSKESGGRMALIDNQNYPTMKKIMSAPVLSEDVRLVNPNFTYKPTSDADKKMILYPYQYDISERIIKGL